MRVVFITREDNNLAGARIRCYNFAKELRGRGIDAEVLSFAADLGAKCGQGESSMNIIDRIRYNAAAIRKLMSRKDSVFIIQRLNYHSFAPYIVHLFKGNKIVLDLDDWEMREDPKYYLGLYPSSRAHFFMRTLARKSIFCIAASGFLKNALSEYNDNVSYIPTAVDTSFFKPGEMEKNSNEIVFSWVGTLDKREYIQNISFMLECFRELRQTHEHIFLDIVGDGIYRNEFNTLLRGYPDKNIRVKGWITPDEMPKYLESIDIGLYPVAVDSKFNKSKSPTKLFEYMSMSKPTVSSSIGEPAGIIRDNYNGFLADNKSRFIDSMRRMANDMDLRKNIGYNARKTIEESYSLSCAGDKICSLLGQIT